MKLEGTNIEPNLGSGTITVSLINTTSQELDRVFKALHTMFNQGVFNVKNGQVILGFDHLGLLDNIRLDAMKWKYGRTNVGRVAMYERAIVTVDLEKMY